MAQVLYVVVERTPAGESVRGVFSSLRLAQDHMPAFGAAHFDDYRMECHVLDEPHEAYLPWEVVLDRDGSVEQAHSAPACEGCDDEHLLRDASYIDAAGERMQVIVWARSKGQACRAAGEYHRWLHDQGRWAGGLPLAAVHTEDAG